MATEVIEISSSDDDDDDYEQEEEEDKFKKEEKNVKKMSVMTGRSKRRVRLVVDKEEEEEEEEEDDDCCILSLYDPPPPGDVAVVAERGQVACRDYPHSRHLCANYPFWETPNLSYCKKCYCYVCDEPAPCKFWDKHCHAFDKNRYWQAMRKEHRATHQKVKTNS